MADTIVTSDTVYEFLDKPGVSNLSKALLSKVNSRIDERIVTTLDENSKDTQVPSALAVYNAINKMSHIKFKTHIGNINDVADPNGSYIYLQRDDETDNTWMMYVYDADLGWINIGDTEVDLSNYWSKDTADVEALKLALGIPDEIVRLDTKIDESVVALNETIKNLPANLLFDEDGDFAIYVMAKDNTSVVDRMFTVERPGMYTFYAERGCPGNPVSVSNSSFRGIAHISQLEDESIHSEATGTQKLYGWMMMFDQDANAYVNYIRRSTPSGWVVLNDKALVESEIARLEAELNELNNVVNSKVDESQLVKLTDEEILSAVDDAYTATAPTL